MIFPFFRRPACFDTSRTVEDRTGLAVTDFWEKKIQADILIRRLEWNTFRMEEIMGYVVTDILGIE